jgi:hypothetical protein
MKSYNNCLWDSQGELKCNFNKDKELIKNANNKVNFIEEFQNPENPMRSALYSDGDNSLKLGELLVSSDKLSTFTFQRDGNAVVLIAKKPLPLPPRSAANKILWQWETGTKNLIGRSYPTTLTLENNGNLVIRDDKNKELWNCCSNRTTEQIKKLNFNNNNHKYEPPYHLSMEPNGWLGIKDKYGVVYWSVGQDIW